MREENRAKWLEALVETTELWERDASLNPAHLEDAFSGELSFGTGGIRAIMGIGPNRMNVLTIRRVVQGLANWLRGKPCDKPVAIGYDTRIHSREFAEITARTLASNGVKVFMFDSPQPTPVLVFAVRRLCCAAGVVITASHNPREFNGFKVYGSDGVQAVDSVAHAIQAEIESIDPFDVKLIDLDVYSKSELISIIDNSLLDEYRQAVFCHRLGIDCSNLKVVYSPFSGTGLPHAQVTLSRLNINFSLVNSQAESDGRFTECPIPNPEDSTAMATGMAQMIAEGADLFLANDPDADRLGVACFENGSARLLTGDEVGLLLFDYLCRHIEEENNKYVAVTTIVSSPLADQIARENGVELRRTLTGFKYIGEQIGKIESEGSYFLFGFEESCGYLRGSYVRDKDGINALMLVCELAAYHKSKGRSLAEALVNLYTRYGFMRGRQLLRMFPAVKGGVSMGHLMDSLRTNQPAVLADCEVVSATDYSHGVAMPSTGDCQQQLLPPANVIEWRLAGGSRVLIRPSGTESKLKAYVFARESTDNAALALLKKLSDEVVSIADRECAYTNVGESVIHVVLLSGGSGTRLWPLSNSTRSKQFLKVLRDDSGNHISMVQRVFSQIDAVDANIDVTIATSASQVEMLSMQVGGRYRLSIEPERRDTAPAIMLACEHLALVQDANEDDIVIVMPIDTYAEQGYYDMIPTVARAVMVGVSDLVLLGVDPTYPSNKYGYIIPEFTETEIWPVESFHEKPDQATAAEYIGRGGLWNCGVFGFRLGWLRSLTRDYVDADSYDEYVSHYCKLPKNSFDYEVVERAKSVSVVPYKGDWKDLGTWSTLTEEMVDLTSGLVWLDEGTTKNVHVINETKTPVVVAGVSDAVVVTTHDGILVTGKEASSHIKEIVEKATLPQPMYERHMWGECRLVCIAEGATTRELTIAPYEQLPHRRCESGELSWAIAKGYGEIAIDGKVRLVKAGDCVTISSGHAYAMRAIEELKVIEIIVGEWVEVEHLGAFWHNDVTGG